MRTFQVLLCVLLLAALCVAQGSGTWSSAPQSGPSASAAGGGDPQSSAGASGQSSQSPASPLDQPTRPDPNADLKKPKPSEFNPSPSGGGQDQILGEIRLMGRNTEIGGDQTRSFKVPGFNDEAEFNFYEDHRWGGQRIQVLAMYRGTNDKSIDPENNSLQKSYLRIYGPHDEMIFGDALVNYSRLTFNQSIKGFSGTWGLGSKVKFSTVAGVYIDRWGSLYKDASEMPGRPYTSFVAGARLEFKPWKEGAIGLNFSSSHDIESTLPTAPAGTSPLPQVDQVGSIDVRYRHKRFNLDAEVAGSGAITDTRTTQSYDADWGARIESSYKYKRIAFRGSYVRYEPGFVSVNARQIADLQDWAFRVSLDLTEKITIDGTARHTNNNLRDQLPFTTSVWGPEGRISFHDMPFYRRMVLDVGWRERLNSASNNSVDNAVRVPYVEISAPFKTTFLTVGFERRQTLDAINPAQTSVSNRPYASLRGIYDVHGWHINPNFRYELERVSQRPGLALVPVNPLLEYDSNRLGTASLLIESPRYFIAELAFRDSSATIYGPSGFSRPSYRAQLTYKIRNDENTTIGFIFERNNNYYFLPSPNYDERVYGVLLVWKFGHRGR